MTIDIKRAAAATELNVICKYFDDTSHSGCRSLTQSTETYEDYISSYVAGSCGKLLVRDEVMVQPYPTVKSVQTHWAQFIGAYRQIVQKDFNSTVSTDVRNVSLAF